MSSLVRPPVAELKKRVHVGCGPHTLKLDWYNVDIRPFPGVDHVCDITEPWTDLSDVRYVYGEHFIEHLDAQQAVAFLAHAHSALVTGGKIRLSTPALEWVMATHFNPSEKDKTSMIAQSFAVNRAFHGWGHRFLWSAPALEWALSSAGYDDVTFFDYGQSETQVFRGLEEHGGYKVTKGIPSTWIVEGTKSATCRPNGEFAEAAEREFTRHVRSGH